MEQLLGFFQQLIAFGTLALDIPQVTNARDRHVLEQVFEFRLGITSLQPGFQFCAVDLQRIETHGLCDVDVHRQGRVLCNCGMQGQDIVLGLHMTLLPLSFIVERWDSGRDFAVTENTAQPDAVTASGSDDPRFQAPASRLAKVETAKAAASSRS
ncbi:hypothetical protein D3C84_846820 [compost metagenome]